MVNVLIPTDFSANAENAFFYALSLLKRKKCTFYITHILGGSAKYFPYKKPEADDLAKKQILQLILKAEKNFSDESYVFFSQVLYGNTVDSIRNEVEDKKINLIVIGVKGRAASDNSVGSTTADIIHKVKCSTLIVPEKATFTPGKNIAFPTDYSIFYGSEILETISFYQKQLHSKIHILYLSKKDEKMIEAQKQNKELLQEYFSENLHCFCAVTSKEIDSAVKSYVANNDIGLIALAARDIHIFQQLLLNPTHTGKIQQAYVPFLVLH